MSLQQIIEDAFENRANFNPNDATDDVRAAVNDVLAQLDAGTLRWQKKKDGEMDRQNQWVKKRVLLSLSSERQPHHEWRS